MQDIEAFLRELVETPDIAVLVVEQNLSMVESAAVRFCMMEKDRMLHGGPKANLNNGAMLMEFLSVQGPQGWKNIINKRRCYMTKLHLLRRQALVSLGTAGWPDLGCRASCSRTASQSAWASCPG